MFETEKMQSDDEGIWDFLKTLAFRKLAVLDIDEIKPEPT